MAHPKTTALRAALCALLALPSFAFADESATGRALQLFHHGRYAAACQLVRKGGVEETPEIRFYLAHCLENGIGGTPRDLSRAKSLYEAAAQDGHPLAREALDRLARDEAAAARLQAEIQAREEAEHRLDLLRKQMEQANADWERQMEQANADWERQREELLGKHAGEQALADAEADYRRKLAQIRTEQNEAESDYRRRLDAANARIRELENRPAPPPAPLPDRPGTRESPLGFAVFAPAQFPPVGADVNGFRLSVFYGRNHDVFGLDIGAFASIADGNLMGVEVSGCFNQVASSDGGVQIAGIANDCSGDFLGVQISGVVNRAGGGLLGGQCGGLNLVSGDLRGIQVGVFNNARNTVGLQIGLVNHAFALRGFQIGLVNLVEEGAFPFIPVFNARF